MSKLLTINIHTWYIPIDIHMIYLTYCSWRESKCFIYLLSSVKAYWMFNQQIHICNFMVFYNFSIFFNANKIIGTTKKLRSSLNILIYDTKTKLPRKLVYVLRFLHFPVSDPGKIIACKRLHIRIYLRSKPLYMFIYKHKSVTKYNQHYVSPYNYKFRAKTFYENIGSLSQSFRSSSTSQLPITKLYTAV